MMIVTRDVALRTLCQGTQQKGQVMKPSDFAKTLEKAEARVVNCALAVEYCQNRVKEATTQLSFQTKEFQEAVLAVNTLRRAEADQHQSDW